MAALGRASSILVLGTTGTMKFESRMMIFFTVIANPCLPGLSDSLVQGGIPIDMDIRTTLYPHRQIPVLFKSNILVKHYYFPYF